MDAGVMTHEWVQGYKQFELVMQCLNELASWDSDQTVRAFQTHGWADATPGASDAQRFSHETTSVSVLFDGGTLAVDFSGLDGMTTMREAFSDLFPALYDLGWRRAQVYHHSSATMPELLSDMGAALPAHMDFDVIAAEVADDFASDGDGTGDDDLGFGSRLIAPPDPNSRDGIAMSQMHDLGLDVEVRLPVSMAPDLGGDVGPIVLDDDEPSPHDLYSEEVTIAPAHRATATRSFAQADAETDDTRPQVPSLGAAKPVASVSVGTQRSFASENPDGSPQQHEPTTVRVAVPETIAQPSLVETKPAVQRAPDVSNQTTTRALNPARTPDRHVLNSVIQFEYCAFYFDMPGTPPEYQLVEDFAQEFEEVIRLRPGQANAPVRWNLLADIDIHFPWSAELLAQQLVADEQAAALLAAQMLALKASRGESLQLRDLIADTEKVAEADAIAASVGRFLLPPKGAAFLDIRPESDTAAERSPRLFSVKGLLDPGPTTFVFVHVDPLDGTSVRRVANALRHLVLATKSSRRRADFPDIQTTTHAREKQVEAMRAELRTEMQQAMEQVMEQTLARIVSKA